MRLYQTIHTDHEVPHFALCCDDVSQCQVCPEKDASPCCMFCHSWHAQCLDALLLHVGDLGWTAVGASRP